LCFSFALTSSSSASDAPLVPASDSEVADPRQWRWPAACFSATAFFVFWALAFGGLLLLLTAPQIQKRQNLLHPRLSSSSASSAALFGR
jgi:hypothetical protein